MGAKTRTTGFYRDDAARIAAEAARIAPPAEPILRDRPTSPSSSRPPAIIIDEPSRAALTPQPAINQNRPAARRAAAAPSDRAPLGRIIARIVIAPFYAAIILGSAALLILAAKFFLKL